MFKASGRGGGAARKAVSVFGVRHSSAATAAAPAAPEKGPGGGLKRRASEKRREKKERRGDGVGVQGLERAASLKEDGASSEGGGVAVGGVWAASSPSSSATACPPSTPVELDSPAMAFLAETWEEAMECGEGEILRYRDVAASLPPVPTYRHGPGIDIDALYRSALLAQIGLDPKDLDLPPPPSNAHSIAHSNSAL